MSRNCACSVCEVPRVEQDVTGGRDLQSAKVTHKLRSYALVLWIVKAQAVKRAYKKSNAS